MRGRCLSYGEGITYWPVVEVVQAARSRPLGPAGRGRRSRRCSARRTSRDVAEEIAWAFRKLLEDVARPAARVVFDDIHWAEPTFLDLVEHVADCSRDAPILLLCMARPELLDGGRPGRGGKLNATTVLLEPLSADETDELIEQLLGDARSTTTLRARIRDAAEGNPLFVEEMLAMVGESPDGDDRRAADDPGAARRAARPARPSERGVLERGAVEGEVFHRGGVAGARARRSRTCRRACSALVRKELVRPDRTQLPGDDAFRFRHLLIRDAAYEALPKATRAELHERFADWLEEHGAGARRARRDPRLPPGAGVPLPGRARAPRRGDRGPGRRAARRLAAAGERAALRDDVAASMVLYERCLALVPDDESALEWQLRLIRLRTHSGDLAGALHQAEDLIEQARRDGDRPRELRVWLARGLASHLAESATADQERPIVGEASRSSKRSTTMRAWRLPGRSSQASSSVPSVGGRWRSPPTARSSMRSGRATSCCSRK